MVPTNVYPNDPNTGVAWVFRAGQVVAASPLSFVGFFGALSYGAGKWAGGGIQVSGSRSAATYATPGPLWARGAGAIAPRYDRSTMSFAPAPIIPKVNPATYGGVIGGTLTFVPSVWAGPAVQAAGIHDQTTRVGSSAYFVAMVPKPPLHALGQTELGYYGLTGSRQIFWTGGNDPRFYWS